MGTKIHALTHDSSVTGTERVPLANNSGASPEVFTSVYATITEIFNAMGIYSGSGSPEGVVTATVGSIYRRTNGGAGTSIYIKESGSGNTGWAAK